MKKEDLPPMGKKRRKSHFAEVITQNKPVFDPRKSLKVSRATARFHGSPGGFWEGLRRVSVFQRRRASSSTWTSTTSWTTRTS